MKTILAHDWLVDIAGAESVLAEMQTLYPEAPIYTLFHGNLKNTPFENATIHHSFLQNIPMINQIYRKIPNLFPLAVANLDIGDADLLLSSSHAAIKALPKSPKTCHICYIHTPMRYIWDLSEQYLASLPMILRPYARFVFSGLRKWDKQTADNVDFFIANSHYVKERVERIYKREAEVVYPPVDLSEKPVLDKENIFVTASRHVPYKKIPLIAEAFAAMPDKKLIVLGDGTDFAKVQAIAARATNIECRGYLPRAEMLSEIGRAKAFVFAADEDFGILPVEAQSLGTPVIAFGKGGVKETVIDEKTGVFFHHQTIEDICQAVSKFETIEDRFDPSYIAQHTQQFSRAMFRQKYQECITKYHQNFKQNK
ncbi:MAG: glycosyltransferase [Brevinema sp.]